MEKRFWADFTDGGTMRARACLIACLATAPLGGCYEEAPPAPQVRPVRAMTVENRAVSEPMVLIGQVRARDEVSLAFRIDGKVTERPISVGDQITTGQLVARLDPQNEQNALRSAEADLAAAQAALSQAERLEGRQRELLSRGFTTRALYDQALQQLQTSQAQIESAQARLRTARDRVNYTELRSEITGTVTAKGTEAGEIVRGGQMIIRVAREGLKDAVFDVPAQLMLIQGVPRDPIVQISLVDNPNIKTTGRVREVAPQADQATRTFPVKVGLVDPPEEMRLGATVTGGVMLTLPPVMSIPGTALIEMNGKPSVWVVDPLNLTVDLRAVDVVRYDATAVIVSRGLRDGELVVTAGVHVLYPGQKVKLLDRSS